MSFDCIAIYRLPFWLFTNLERDIVKPQDENVLLQEKTLETRQ